VRDLLDVLLVVGGRTAEQQRRRITGITRNRKKLKTITKASVSNACSTLLKM